MTQEQRSLVDFDLDQLASIIDNATSTKNIVGGMVQVMDSNDYIAKSKSNFEQEQLLAS